MEEIDDCKDLLLQAITNFKADHVDAYDSDSDDEATKNAIFMVNLSPVGSINDDTVEPRYDLNILSKVPHYDTYHESDVVNSDKQELEYIENIVSNNESYDELTSNNNVISYADYMVTIGNDEYNYVPPPVQNNDRIFFTVNVGIKSLLNAASTTAAHIRVNAAQLFTTASTKVTTVSTKLMMLKELMLLVKKLVLLKEFDLLKWDQQVVPELVALRNFARRYGSRFCTHDYALWEVIENGATLSKITVVEGVEKVMPITSVEDKA
ncbi:hypothetical protein Tco_0502995 [Tanacetum coccineum]